MNGNFLIRVMEMKNKFAGEITDGIDSVRLIFFRFEINFTLKCEGEII
jgi:hypothetical protein